MNHSTTVGHCSDVTTVLGTDTQGSKADLSYRSRKIVVISAEFLVISVTVLYFRVTFVLMVQFFKWGLTQFANKVPCVTKAF